MAANLWSAQSGEVATGTSVKTLLMATPLTIAAYLDVVRISFKGVTAGDAPILVQLVQADGVGTSTSATPEKLDPARAEALLIRHRHTFTAEPSTNTVKRSALVHPQGHRDWYLRLELPVRLVMPAGTYWGVRVTAGASVNAVVEMVGEE